MDKIGRDQFLFERMGKCWYLDSHKNSAWWRHNPDFSTWRDFGKLLLLIEDEDIKIPNELPFVCRYSEIPDKVADILYKFLMGGVRER